MIFILLRTFDLLTQVSGRAGRAEKSGRVIVQTYESDNYSIVAAKEHDYEKFYSQEILLREQLNYPPFCDITLINVSGDDENKVIEDSRKIREVFEEYFTENESVKVLREVPSPISKIKNKYRFRIIIKSDVSKKINDEVYGLLNSDKFDDISSEFTVDFNPISFN